MCGADSAATICCVTRSRWAPLATARGLVDHQTILLQQLVDGSALEHLATRGEDAQIFIFEALRAQCCDQGGPLGAHALGLEEKAYGHIGRNPATGSPRHAHELNLPGLRAWPLTRYPHLVFYVERPDHIDVWRVLHGQRDIPAWMQEPDAV